MMHQTPVIPPLPSPEGGSAASPSPNPPVIPSFSPQTPGQTPAWMRGAQTQPGYGSAFPYHQTPYLAVPTLPGQVPGSYYLAPTQLPPTGTPGGQQMAPVGPSGFSADWTGFPITTTVPPQGTPWQGPGQAFQGQAFQGQAPPQQAHPGTAFSMFQQPLPAMGGFMPQGFVMQTPFVGGGGGGMQPMGGMGGMGGGGMAYGWTPGAFGGMAAAPSFAAAGAAVAAATPAGGHHMLPTRGVSEGLDKFDKFSEENAYGPVLDPFFVKITKAVVELNPLLTPPPEDGSDRPYLKWNMLFPTAQCQRSSDPGHRSWAAGRYAPATWPRVSSLRIISRHFPWEIQVKAEDTTVGVTCQDVIEGIHEFMYGRVSSQQLDSATQHHKRIVGQSYWHNRSTARDVPGGRLHNTLLRCDWLGLNTRFGGISHVEERVVKEIASGANLPCTFELKCLQRYAMTEEEVREHEARDAEAERERERELRHSRRGSRATSRAPSRPPSRVARTASVHTVSSDTSSS
ncbi:hypothetical protein BDW22DRAFT_983922 [Trametopsis cervina]|nr:hypothetical protein BDW22DRAFT_983922 [Trametopsis cervina]